MCHTYVRNIFGGRRTLASEGRPRKGVELLTYCCLGNSTKCSSNALLLVRIYLCRCFVPPSQHPFPASSLFHSSRIPPYSRAVSLHRGIVGVASTSLGNSLRRMRSSCDVNCIRIRWKIRLVSWSRGLR